MRRLNFYACETGLAPPPRLIMLPSRFEALGWRGSSISECCSTQTRRSRTFTSEDLWDRTSDAPFRTLKRCGSSKMRQQRRRRFFVTWTQQFGRALLVGLHEALLRSIRFAESSPEGSAGGLCSL